MSPRGANAIAIVLTFMLCGTWAGLVLIAPTNARWPSPGMLAALALNLGLLMLCWGGVAMALAATGSHWAIVASGKLRRMAFTFPVFYSVRHCDGP